jgi:rod shape-determining protein MreD
MQFVKITLLILLSVVLQIALVAKISIFGDVPDLPLTLVVSVSLLKGPLYGELVGFFTGFTGDLLSGGQYMGLQSISKLLVGCITGLFRDRLYSDNPATQAISGFVATLLAKAIIWIHLSLLTGSWLLDIRITGVILTAVLNSAGVVVIYPILKKLLGKESRGLPAKEYW